MSAKNRLKMLVFWPITAIWNVTAVMSLCGLGIGLILYAVVIVLGYCCVLVLAVTYGEPHDWILAIIDFTIITAAATVFAVAFGWCGFKLLANANNIVKPKPYSLPKETSVPIGDTLLRGASRPPSTNRDELLRSAAENVTPTEELLRGLAGLPR